MNVLLDEDVKERLRHHFGADITVETAGYRGFKGLQNGALLAAAERSFDALVTLDSNLPHQRTFPSMISESLSYGLVIKP